jgi:hypothetical protein
MNELEGVWVVSIGVKENSPHGRVILNYPFNLKNIWVQLKDYYARIQFL